MPHMTRIVALGISFVLGAFEFIFIGLAINAPSSALAIFSCFFGCAAGCALVIALYTVITGRAPI